MYVNVNQDIMMIYMKAEHVKNVMIHAQSAMEKQFMTVSHV